MNLALGVFLFGLALCRLFDGAGASTESIGVCGGRLIDVLIQVCKDHEGVRNRKRSDPYLMMPWGHRWTRAAKETCTGRLANLRCMCCRSAYGPCSYEEMVVYHCQSPPKDMQERVLRMNEGRE